MENKGTTRVDSLRTQGNRKLKDVMLSSNVEKIPKVDG